MTKKQLKKLFILFLATMVTWQPQLARSSDLMTTTDKVIYEKDETRVGVEVEFWGLTPKQAADVVAAELHGKVTTNKTKIITTLKEIKADGTRVYNYEDAVEFVISTRELGDIILKPDSNQVDDIHNPDPSLSVVELVSPPIVESQIDSLDRVIKALQKAGAHGTDAAHAVSTQMNVEVAGGKKENFDQKELESIVNLMRVVIHHEKQMRAQMDIPDIRAPYVQSFSPGLKDRLLRKSYQITARGLYDDVIYRQSLEMLGFQDAWTMPIEKARKTLLAQEHPIVPQVVKQNFLRVSSLLMWMFPDDPMSKIYEQSGWAKARPLIEWRGFNNTFDVKSPFRQSVGLLQGVHKFGPFDHDHLVRSMVGLEERTTRELRKQSLQSVKDGKPFLFRYFIGDPTGLDRADYAEQKQAFTGVVGFLAPQQQGEKPVVIPGESIVFHRLPIHRNVVVGKYNPTLINTYIVQALENKYAEARFWNEYVPGSMPETVLLENLTSPKDDIRVTVQKLNSRFPNGWVLKGVWDIGSEKQIITDMTEVVAEVQKYRASNYDAYRAEITEYYRIHKGSFDNFQYDVAQHPGYKGWKISQILSKPEVAIVQSRMPIDREFRVEVVAGKVLSNGSTVDRYRYEFELSGRMNEYVPPSMNMIRSAEAFAQKVVSQLPPEMRSMTFGMDVAILKGGADLYGNYKAMMVESNPGGASNFLHEEDPETVKILGERLMKIPQEVANGKINLGLSSEEQMRYLAKKFTDWKIDPAKLFPGMIFKKDRIVDPEYLTLKAKIPEYEMLKGLARENQRQSRVNSSPTNGRGVRAPMCRAIFETRAK